MLKFMLLFFAGKINKKTPYYIYKFKGDKRMISRDEARELSNKMCENTKEYLKDYRFN